MNMLKKSVLSVFFCSCLIFSGSIKIYAQVGHLAASNLALGGGGTAYLDSYHANFVNPANLMLNEGKKPRFSLGILGGLSTNAGGSLLNINVYNQYFTGGLTISDAIAGDVLDKSFGTDAGNIRSAGFQLDVIPVGTAYRSKKWAASAALRSRILIDTQVSRGLAELGIFGLDGDVFSQPTPVNFSIEALGFYELSFGYSRRLLTLPKLFGFAENIKVYAGIAPKLLLGAHNSRLTFNSTLQLQGVSANEVDLIRHDFAYQFETTGSLAAQLNQFYEQRQATNQVPDILDFVDPQPQDFYEIKASGVGFDLGGTIEMDVNLPFLRNFFKGKEKLRIGISLTDIGKISYKDEIGRFTANDVLEWQGFAFDQETIDNEFNGDSDAYFESVLSDTIATEIYGSFAPEEVSSINSSLPSRANFGTQLIMNRLSISVDLGKGFVEEGVNSKRVSMSSGIEYRLFGFLPFRGGIRTGGQTSTSYSAGFGIEFKNFEFSFAASTVPNSLKRGSDIGAAWSGLVLRF